MHVKSGTLFSMSSVTAEIVRLLMSLMKSEHFRWDSLEDARTYIEDMCFSHLQLHTAGPESSAPSPGKCFSCRNPFVGGRVSSHPLWPQHKFCINCKDLSRCVVCERRAPLQPFYLLENVQCVPYTRRQIGGFVGRASFFLCGECQGADCVHYSPYAQKIIKGVVNFLEHSSRLRLCFNANQSTAVEFHCYPAFARGSHRHSSAMHQQVPIELVDIHYLSREKNGSSTSINTTHNSWGEHLVFGRCECIESRSRHQRIGHDNFLDIGKVAIKQARNVGGNATGAGGKMYNNRAIVPLSTELVLNEHHHNSPLLTKARIVPLMFRKSSVGEGTANNRRVSQFSRSFHRACGEEAEQFPAQLQNTTIIRNASMGRYLEVAFTRTDKHPSHNRLPKLPLEHTTNISTPQKLTLVPFTPSTAPIIAVPMQDRRNSHSRLSMRPTYPFATQPKKASASASITARQPMSSTGRHTIPPTDQQFVLSTVEPTTQQYLGASAKSVRQPIVPQNAVRELTSKVQDSQVMKRKLRCVLIAEGLPIDIFGSTLAHELTHAFLFLSGYRIPLTVEEGVCNAIGMYYALSTAVKLNRKIGYVEKLLECQNAIPPEQFSQEYLAENPTVDRLFARNFPAEHAHCNKYWTKKSAPLRKANCANTDKALRAQDDVIHFDACELSITQLLCILRERLVLRHALCSCRFKRMLIGDTVEYAAAVLLFPLLYCCGLAQLLQSPEDNRLLFAVACSCLLLRPMSKKYYDRVLQGSGLSSSKFHSKFGASILKKFGWSEGEGLGKDSTGLTDCIQVKRRKEKIGLGAETPKVTADQWTNWWDNLYNSTAKNMLLQPNGTDTPSSSEEDSSDDDDVAHRLTLKARRRGADLDVTDGRNSTKRGNLQTGKLQRVKTSEAELIGSKACPPSLPVATLGKELSKTVSSQIVPPRTDHTGEKVLSNHEPVETCVWQVTAISPSTTISSQKPRKVKCSQCGLKHRDSLTADCNVCSSTSKKTKRTKSRH